MSSFLTSITASVNEESRVEKLKLLQHTVAILCRSINYCSSIVLHNIWRSDQSDSTPDIPGKILLPGPRKWTKVTRPSLAVGERCGLGTRLAGSLAVTIDIANVHLGHWNSSHSTFACSVARRIANLLLLATGSAGVGGARVKCVHGPISTEI